MPAIIEAWRAGILRRDSIMRNISAGVVVGVVALPLAMAFAVASGVAPQHGLYTALVAGLLVTLLGGTRVQIAGPTGAFAVLLFGVTAEYGFAGLQLVTLMAGALLVLLGLSKLGGLVRYIPESVILGFTAGIAVVIFIGQWENFLGLPNVASGAMYEKLPGLLAALPHLHPATAALGLTSLLVVALWPRVPVLGKIPSPVVALVGATVYVALFQPIGVATIGSVFGGIPLGLPSLTLPQFTPSLALELLQPAVAIALLGAIESLLSATVADGMMGTRHNPNQELVGQGIANIGASLFGGFAATGAVARTATNVRNGGDSPVSGLAHAATIVIVLLVLAPFAIHVPLTSLAAVLFVVAFNMSQIWRIVRVSSRAPRSDVIIMLTTLALAVFADIIVAVEVGIILAMLNFFRQMTSAVEVRTLSAAELSSKMPASKPGSIPEDFVVFTIEGPFFFGAVEEFASALRQTGTDPKAVVIKLARVPFIDLSGMVALRDAVTELEKRGVAVALCCANAAVATKLRRAEVSSATSIPLTTNLEDTIQSLSEMLEMGLDRVTAENDGPLH